MSDKSNAFKEIDRAKEKTQLVVRRFLKKRVGELSSQTTQGIAMGLIHEACMALVVSVDGRSRDADELYIKFLDVVRGHMGEMLERSVRNGDGDGSV